MANENSRAYEGPKLLLKVIEHSEAGGDHRAPSEGQLELSPPPRRGEVVAVDETTIWPPHATAQMRAAKWTSDPT